MLGGGAANSDGRMIPDDPTIPLAIPLENSKRDKIVRKIADYTDPSATCRLGRDWLPAEERSGGPNMAKGGQLSDRPRRYQVRDSDAEISGRNGAPLLRPSGGVTLRGD